MYAQYRCIKAAQCLRAAGGHTPAEGASCFVNPLTALGMVETMRAEGHTALVHTAAASNLGQMLVRICLKDGVPLVNVVRKAEQVDAPARHRRDPRVQLERAHLHGGPDRGARRHRRHPGLRRDRRRQARRPDPHRDGGGAQPDGQGVQPLRLDHPQAGLHLRQPRPRPDRVHPHLRHGLGRRRLAADAVPPEDRPRGRAEAARARRRRDQDHLRQHLHEGDLAAPRRWRSTRSPSTASWRRAPST